MVEAFISPFLRACWKQNCILRANNTFCSNFFLSPLFAVQGLCALSFCMTQVNYVPEESTLKDNEQILKGFSRKFYESIHL